jgi:hypothetical protein
MVTRPDCILGGDGAAHRTGKIASNECHDGTTESPTGQPCPEDSVGL